MRRQGPSTGSGDGNRLQDKERGGGGGKDICRQSILRLAPCPHALGRLEGDLYVGSEWVADARRARKQKLKGGT